MKVGVVVDGRKFGFVAGFLDDTRKGLTKRLPKHYETVRIGLKLRQS